MKKSSRHILARTIALGLFLALSIPPAFPQSQSQNGQIEGTVLDQNNASVANAVITVTNIETGATRTRTTYESGVYRFPLLPLGTYRITAEAASFKKFVQKGVTLSTGQTATIDIQLQTGDINEVVTVSLDTSIADAGKTDLGRVMNSREVQNLPLISRNPYNFGLLQANVTGRPSPGFHRTNTMTANGYVRQVNYQLDGNTNTTYDARVRFMLLSDVYVGEVQLVTNGFGAEFGDTPGLIMNIVTPSGTNRFSGAVSYRFRRPPFSSRLFFYPSSEFPDNNADNFTATIGAPIVKDRWQFYFGYEYQHRDDDAGAAVRLLTITPTNREQLIAAGLSPSIFPSAIPRLETGPFYIFRTDLQLNKNNRLAVRFNHSDLYAKNWIAGGLNTLEKAFDASSEDYAIAPQLTSYTGKFFNELRFQYGQRGPTSPCRNEFSGTGPAISIPGVAQFGSPDGGRDCPDIIPPIPLRVTQFQDNLTQTLRTHVVKLGGGFSFHDYNERKSVVSRYTFSSIAAYVAARTGSNPRSYRNYSETFGNPQIPYSATFWNVFAQDDWKLTRNLKINVGLRYDLYRPPEADPNSPFYLSQKFNLDKNNFAPRLGVVYSLREGNRPTVIRAGAGLYFAPPLLAIYRDVIHLNGSLGYYTVAFNGNNNGTTTPDLNAPNFPNGFSGSFPAGSTVPAQNIYTLAPDFESMYSIHANIQLEQAITKNLSFAVGYTYSGGRHIPVYRQINRINPVRFLADGRPVFSTAFKLDTRFNNISITESAAVSRYEAFVLQLKQRFSDGLQFSANYTFSKATDDAPDLDLEGESLSDPTNRQLDRGFSSADQRHNFVMTLVYQPQFKFENKTLRYLADNNQLGIIARANSGERFNIICNCDLNRDGGFSDRPIGIRRNSGKTPPLFNLDLRYSRFFNFTERYKLEVFGEFTNLFNINSIVAYNNVTVTTNTTTGELIGSLPDFRALNQSTAQESRQFQLGLKFIF